MRANGLKNRGPSRGLGHDYLHCGFGFKGRGDSRSGSCSFEGYQGTVRSNTKYDVAISFIPSLQIASVCRI
jgi:hypothetical protein